MASGFGMNGGTGRCFPFWQEFHKCYAMADNAETCRLLKDDYFECLYHAKEIDRARRLVKLRDQQPKEPRAEPREEQLEPKKQPQNEEGSS